MGSADCGTLLGKGGCWLGPGLPRDARDSRRGRALHEAAAARNFQVFASDSDLPRAYICLSRARYTSAGMSNALPSPLKLPQLPLPPRPRPAR